MPIYLSHTVLSSRKIKVVFRERMPNSFHVLESDD